MFTFKLLSLITAIFLETSYKSKNPFSTHFFPFKRTFWVLASSDLGDMLHYYNMLIYDFEI